MRRENEVLASPSSQATGTAWDVWRVREDFPILKTKVRGKPLIYLDNAATAQKPQAVLDALQRFYLEECANIHRGVHYLSERATLDHEAARRKVQHFLHAADAREIIFVRGATEGINLVAHAWGRKNVRAGDEILISAMEHHSNIVPWQILCEEKNARLVVAPMNDRGELLLDEFEKLLNPRVKIVSLTQVSNALGTINPVREIIDRAHQRGIPVLLDGAQAAPHLSVNVQQLDCDFYAFSGHKLFGPTGIGVLYGKIALLEAMPPFQGGGDMISSVTFEKTTYNSLPFKFEAGTPDIAAAIGLGAAVDYLNQIAWENAASYERGLLSYATEKIAQIPGVRLIGTAREKVGVLSFVLDGVHAHDAGAMLDQRGIAIRTGHHCAQPVMERFQIAGTMRASLAFYNTRDEIDALVAGIKEVREVFA